MRNRLATILPFIFFSMLSVIFSARISSAGADARKAIEDVLHTQQGAWNRGDLDAFMTGYWNSPELTFFSGAKEHDGWQAALDRYRAAMPARGTKWGSWSSPDYGSRRSRPMPPLCAAHGH